MLSLFFTIFALFYLIRTNDLLYRFQIKEYRIDRFIGSIHDEGFVYVFLTGRKLPGITIRNITITCISLVFFIFYMRIIMNSFLLITGSILLSPFISFLIIFLAVGITGIFSHVKRFFLLKKAKKILHNSKAVIIGITGSYGKTTTKEYLFRFLQTTYKTAKTDENKNTEIGVALSIIKNLKKNTQFFIAEMGAYKRGEIAFICKLVRPTYGIITGIGNQHLKLFGSRENILRAKSELLEALPEKGVGIVATAKPYLFTVNTHIKAKLLFISPLDSYKTNLALAKKLAVILKVPFQNILRVSKKIEKEMKPKLIKGIHSAYIINHSYSSNLEGFLQHIKDITNFKKMDNKIIISRGIIELGNEKTISYKQIIHELEKKEVMLLTTDEIFTQNNSKNVRHFDTEQKLVTYLESHADNKTVILIEGRFQKETLNKLLTHD